MSALGARLVAMTNDNNDVLTDRYERRLAEECGKVRVEVAQVRMEMMTGFADQRAASATLRAEMIERNAELLKWILVFNATMIVAIAMLLVLLR